jgi:hypothetical protein
MHSDLFTISKESLGFTVKPNTHEKKTTSQPKRRRPSSGSKPSRKYPKRTSNGSVTKAKPVLQTQKKVKLIPFEGEHDDDCYICYDGGELVCCDYCSKAFHPQCHIPPLTAIPGDDWACCECKATRELLILISLKTLFVTSSCTHSLQAFPPRTHTSLQMWRMRCLYTTRLREM